MVPSGSGLPSILRLARATTFAKNRGLQRQIDAFWIGRIEKVGSPLLLLSYFRKQPVSPLAIEIPILFRGFDRNRKLVRVVLESPAGRGVRERGAPEGRTMTGLSGVLRI
jgi:hypothetical protein